MFQTRSFWDSFKWWFVLRVSLSIKQRSTGSKQGFLLSLLVFFLVTAFLFCFYCFKNNFRSLDTWIVNYWLRQEAVICICITHYLNTYVIHLYPGWQSCNVKIPIVYCSLFVTKFNPFRIPFDLEFVFDGRARLPVNKMSSYCSEWCVMPLLCWITWS